jgi:hypothetical protein
MNSALILFVLALSGREIARLDSDCRQREVAGVDNRVPEQPARLWTLRGVGLSWFRKPERELSGRSHESNFPMNAADTILSAWSCLRPVIR